MSFKFAKNEYNEMEDLILELKEKLIAQLNLKHLTPEEIDSDQPLFGVGIGLDSIDALEIIVMLDNDYGIKLTNQEEAREIFTSVRTIANYIHKHQANA
ncbi:MAG TPA: phosphopantetheine-binding protein [Saprospiraceae bacterium]|nr:MAG: phosphopantetheine-binding protein [Saprospiraceae bacterium]HNQ41534.1 phosphopantetheine-binding protein [Saprospiraceae bacterium]HNU17172.1 phosphopantetheine-binding protein [Saprospiraceae bacterium]HRN32660.1 phosphopantetheine-binding protein [Saprospiraceae bacterium]HRP84861.1 phosphopantetheine-binding protein [Saprospiraceae bacterium]